MCVCVCVCVVVFFGVDESRSLSDLQQTLRRMSELEVLANNMSESVKEKSIALTHQKKANK